ncbi:hypothetical protein FGO68_gene15357 [Halteria grandinella]|uniref:Uncharacterized protein n=1 Tax=Halteria grandinella TaxID=5974 RepID=A0A8J8P649_HALGN|nr:hypothetical protein FGO68_gene15357 [Halteria grandinella]
MTSIIQLPSVSGKWVSIEVDLSAIPMGMGRFNQKQPSSSFQFTPNSHQIGSYRIGITLIDNMFPMKTRKVEYSFLVTVLLQDVKESEAKVNFTIPEGSSSNSTKSKQVQIVSIESAKCTRDQQLTVLLSKCGKPGIILDMLFNQSKPFQLSMPSQDSLNISYNLINSDPEKPSFTIQLSYSNPSQVSASTELDQVKITILKTIQFEDETFKIILQKKTSTVFKVQPVMTKSKALSDQFVCRGSQVDTVTCKWGHICDHCIHTRFSYCQHFSVMYYA